MNSEDALIAELIFSNFFIDAYLFIYEAANSD
jgi:hypothetical protein